MGGVYYHVLSILPSSHAHLFLFLLLEAYCFPTEIDCHIIALDYEMGCRFRDLNYIYATIEFNGEVVLPNVVANYVPLDDSSSDE